MFVFAVQGTPMPPNQTHFEGPIFQNKAMKWPQS